MERSAENNRENVQYVVLWNTFTGKSNDPVLKKGKTAVTDTWNNLHRQRITSEMK